MSNQATPGILTSELAHKTLLEYFSKKEYYPQEKINLDSLMTNIHDDDDDEQPMCIMFDTLYTVHLNKDKVLDGIVTYWQMPCGSSGSCWLPHRVMITSINNRYTIINRDFIPDSYSIDSIVPGKNQISLLGNTFDCSIQKNIKPYKASIKK